MLEQTKQNTNILKDAQQQLHKTELNALDTMDTLTIRQNKLRVYNKKYKKAIIYWIIWVIPLKNETRWWVNMCT